jgi:hypothetical protein
VVTGQGHQIENINNNNNLHSLPAFQFSGIFSRCFENTRESLTQPSSLLVLLLVFGELNVHGEFRYSERGFEQMSRNNLGESSTRAHRLRELL